MERPVFVLKPVVRSGGGNYSLQWGDTVVLETHGAKRLGKRAHEIRVPAL